MATNRRHSYEEISQISNRMKSARALSGLTQEKFAEKNAISLTSLKCWEMGRAVPRREGVQSYINALNKLGIEISLGWIFEGSGPGPTYMNGTQIEKPKITSDYFDTQIDLFKKNLLAKGLNPIVSNVNDDDMAPHFNQGDIIGAFYVTMNEVLSLPLENIVETPWLLMLDGKTFVSRFLAVGEREGQIFYRSIRDPIIRSSSIRAIGRICWHYRDLCQPQFDDKVTFQAHDRDM
jgi:transcriptional regulator with XRE-family HTH domain